MKRLHPLALILLMAGCHSQPDASSDETDVKPLVQATLADVRAQTLRDAIAVDGTLSPLADEEAKVVPLVAGRIHEIYVRTGDHAFKGQILATLDPGPLTGQLQQAEAAVKTDAETLRQAVLNLQVQQASQRSAVAQAETNLRAQQIAYQKAKAGPRPQEIAQAQAALVSAEAASVAAQQNLSRSQTLATEGLLARKDLEAAIAQAGAAQAQVESARQAMSLMRQGNRPEDVASAFVAVQQATEQLQAARQSEVQNAVKAQDVRIAEAQLQGAKGALNAARAQLGALTIVAPLAGTVVGRTLNAGEWIDTSGAVAQVANLDRVRLLLNVPLAQIEKVAPGQTVEFTVESDPRSNHTAQVTVVDRAVDPNTNTVQVEAVADNRDGRLRDDGFVKGLLVVKVRPHVLTVPSSALVSKDGADVVFVVGSDDVAHAHEVKTGLRDGDRVEILTGLKLNDKVVTEGAFELEDGAHVRTGQ